MRCLILLSIVLLSSCRSPYYMPDKLNDLDADIKEAAQYMLTHKINKVTRDSTAHTEMVERLKKLKVDYGEILLTQKNIRSNEPNDSIVVFTRIRKASLMVWGVEDLIYDFSTSGRFFFNHTEEGDYQFRKISEKVYYRRYYTGIS